MGKVFELVALFAHEPKGSLHLDVSLPPWVRGTVPVAAGFLAVVLVVPFWPTFVSPNEWPRIYQALALVHRGSLSINEEVARWGSCEDLSVASGRLYPNKAPGLLPLLLPGALVAHSLGCGQEELKLAYFWGRLLAVTLPWLWVSGWVARYLTRRWGVPGSLMATVLVAASPWLVTGTLVFAHALAGACLLGGLVASRGQGSWSLGLAGFLWGWAAVSEYPTLLLGTAWMLWLTWERRWKVWAAYLGMALPLLLLAGYNWSCFGSPLVLSSARELFPQFSALSQEGLYGISWPKAKNLALFLFSRERGLIFWAPLLLLGLWRPRGEPLAQRAWLGTILLLVFLSGYGGAHGGWFPGPRYLLAAFPLLAISGAHLLARAWSHWGVRLAAFALAFWSIPAAFLPLFTFPLSPQDFPIAPLRFHWVLLAAGVFSPGLLPTLWPLVFLMSLVLAWLLFGLGDRMALGGLVLAVALWLVTAATKPPLGFRQRLELAVIHDLYTATKPSWLAALEAEVDEGQRKLLWRWLRQRPQ
ncbi:MAG: hypothetical protein ACUVRQ_05090 [Thermoanaerobaculaceae bacterium]